MEKGVGGKTWLYRSTTGKAEGPYANVTKSFFVKGIDGFPFEDDDGLYFLWGGGNIGKLNAARSGFEGPVRQLVEADGAPRSEARRVGKEVVITFRTWWSA